MIIESRIDGFIARVERQVGMAIDDAGTEAASRPGAPHDTRGEMTGLMQGRIGSDQPYARAQERGAYIRPRRRKALLYGSGKFSMRSRLPARAYLANTARRWAQIVTARLGGA